MIDLHIHTNDSSDGQHSPREIFTMAKRIGLQAIAFADHNSIGSVEEGMSLSREFSLEFVPAIELNTIYQEQDLHLLGYYLDYQSKSLKEWLISQLEAKKQQAKGRLRRLKELGFALDQEDLERFSPGKIPAGSTFLQAIISREENKADPRLKPYTNGERSDSPYFNFYLDYLRSGKSAFVPLKAADTIKVIGVVKGFGGIPILAHPYDINTEIIIKLIEAGLCGLEAYSSYHSIEQCEYFRRLAEQQGILTTAGSDFHGYLYKPDVHLGGITGNSYQLLKELKSFAREQEATVPV
ncbi:MAG: PHP domain-containing protein [Deltaproteobacteria bacterium]|nr:MAG: PHP domain-containing protein [Deltaproteobacteria bacterium]